MNKTEFKKLIPVSILLALSFPPFPTGIMAPFALAYFLWFLKDKGARESFRLGYWLGLIWGAMTLFWIAASTLTGAILAITINALHYAIVFWIYALLKKRSEKLAIFSLPFIWTAMEYLRLFSDIRFNWMTLAYTQTYYRPFIQIIEISGYLGLSFLLIVITTLIYAAFRWKKSWLWISPATTAAILAVLFIYGQIRIDTIENASYPLIKAGLVQPNVDPYEKWEPQFQKEAFDMLMDASREMLPLKPQIIVWPETATPFYLRSRVESRHAINNFVDSTGIYLLTGTPDYAFNAQDDDYRTYNAAFFFRPGDPVFDYYYKLALVPAAESMPFKNVFPFLRKLNVGGGDFFHGNKFTVFKIDLPARSGRFDNGAFRPDQPAGMQHVKTGLAAVICFDSVFPHVVRGFVKNGADLLTIITNDGWFGLTSGPYQHARYAVFRAIENRVSIIRNANTGISCFIDPTGKVLQKAGLNIRKDMVAYLPVDKKHSFYTKHGEWFGKFTLIVSFLILLFKLISWIWYERKAII